MPGEVLVFFFGRPMYRSFGIVPKMPSLGYDHLILIAYGFELSIEGGQKPTKLAVNGGWVPGFHEVGFEQLFEGVGQG